MFKVLKNLFAKYPGALLRGLIETGSAVADSSTNTRAPVPAANTSSALQRGWTAGLLLLHQEKFGDVKNRVFLDYASATPVRREVLEAIVTYHKEYFANPSALYTEARKSKERMQHARAEVGQFLNCAKERIVFTASGTESNNLAFLGVFENARKNGIMCPHIITVATEHTSTREVCEEIRRRGGEVTLLVPNNDGLITASQVLEAITENTVLVSVMIVNNEIGVIQPIREIGLKIREKRNEIRDKKRNGNRYLYFHTDACQAPLFQPLDISTLGVDMLTLDGLKVGGPIGVGCLFVGPNVEISPIVFGGGQENGLRSATENIAGMIGLATALSLAKLERREISEKLEKLRDYFIDQILKRFPEAEMNGSRKHRVVNNVNVCFPGLDAEYLVVALDTYGIACSYSSSCRTLKEDSSSYVIESIGKPLCAHSSLRFTLGYETTKEDIDKALMALEKAVKQVGR